MLDYNSLDRVLDLRIYLIPCLFRSGDTAFERDR
jgi:hypothetical protein